MRKQNPVPCNLSPVLGCGSLGGGCFNVQAGLRRAIQHLSKEKGELTGIIARKIEIKIPKRATIGEEYFRVDMGHADSLREQKNYLLFTIEGKST